MTAIDNFSNSSTDSYSIKKGVRILAIASGPVEGKRSTIAIGVIQNGNNIEGILSTRIAVDGDDASAKIAKMVLKSKFARQIRIVAFDGAAIAGLNIIDTECLRKKLGVHVLFATRHKPRKEALKNAIKAFGKAEGKSTKRKLEAYEKLRFLNDFQLAGFRVLSSMNESSARLVAESTIGALRLAHMIARGISTGESKGRI
ncbi:MAG: DUF99 family protein [Candidatus Micrarchaeia archaeon]